MRYKVREARSSVIGWIKMLGSTSSVLKQKKDENLAKKPPLQINTRRRWL